MTSDQVTGLARAILTYGGGWLTAWGLSSSTVATVIGLGSAVVGAVWSYYSNSKASIAASAAKNG